MGFVPVAEQEYPAIVLEGKAGAGKSPVVALLQRDGKFSRFVCFIQGKDDAKVGDFYRVRVVKVSKSYAFVEYVGEATSAVVSLFGADFLEKEARLREAPQLRERAKEIRKFDALLKDALTILASRLK